MPDLVGLEAQLRRETNISDLPFREKKVFRVKRLPKIREPDLEASAEMTIKVVYFGKRENISRERKHFTRQKTFHVRENISR